MKKRRHLLVSGRVQGVAYRAATVRIAVPLGLTGWVRNLPDGRVEILAEGDDIFLERLEAWARKGPLQAKVATVEVQEEPATGEFDDFELRL